MFGYRLVRLDWEPLSAGGEKTGLDGGWLGDIERADGAPIGSGESVLLGLNVEDVLDWIDRFVTPVDPCGHKWTTENALARQRAQVQTHGPDCRYHLTYSLPWFRGQSNG